MRRCVSRHFISNLCSGRCNHEANDREETESHEHRPLGLPLAGEHHADVLAGPRPGLSLALQLKHFAPAGDKLSTAARSARMRP
jgi:hypothetical protein